MNGQKNGNLIKMVAFFLIAIILTVLIAFSASGWHEDENQRPESDNSTESEVPKDDNVDEKPEGPDTPVDTQPINPIPTYYHYLTGYQIPKENIKTRPYGILVDSNAPLYGISDAYLTIEIPIENGRTRYLLITDSADTIGKLGSIAETRSYINEICSYFSVNPLHYGYDDKFAYSSNQNDESIDLSKLIGYSYSEQEKYVYTNGDLIHALISNNNINRECDKELTAPFIPMQSSGTTTSNIASKIKVVYGENNITEIVYSSDDDKYIIKKNDNALVDLHNNKTLSYDNALILSTDSTTIETEAATQMVLNTQNGGRGYYATDGKYISVSWSVDDSGKMTVYNGTEKLTINPGTTYISFIKSADINKLIIE